MAIQRRNNTVTDSTDSVVRIEGVTKDFGSLRAVDDVTIPIEDGEFLTILGPSGAGKTTLLHMIAGFETPTEGEIYINDKPVSNKPPNERDIGLVFQSHALFPHMTVEENISFPLKMRRENPENISEKVTDILELVRLPTDYVDKPVDDLSGGQQQRVAFARAIVYEPTLLLLDEPLSSLDKKLREEMRAELTRIHEETELTIVHVTHNQTEALSMADRIAVIRDGGLEQLAPVQELYAAPETPFVADFIGNTTLLYGTITDRGEGTSTVAIGDGTIQIPSGVGEDHSDVVIGLRAEQVTLGSDTVNTVEGTLERVSFEGDRTQYHVSVPAFGETIRLITENRGERLVHERGDTVTIGWDPEDVFVYPDE